MLTVTRPSHDYYCPDPFFENAFTSKIRLPDSDSSPFFNYKSVEMEQKLYKMRRTGGWKTDGKVLGKRSPAHVVRINNADKAARKGKTSLEKKRDLQKTDSLSFIKEKKE
jgi:hypothetical protein